MKCDNKQTLKLTQGNPITRLIKSFSPAFPILLAACGDDPASNSDSIAKIFNDAVIEDAVGDAVAAQCGQGGSSCPDGFECASFSGGQWGSLQLHLGHNDVTSQHVAGHRLRQLTLKQSQQPAPCAFRLRLVVCR